MKKILSILLALVVVFSLAGVLLAGTLAKAEPGPSIELSTTADAQVRSGYPDATDPGYQFISVGNFFGVEFYYCYWKFDLTGIDRSDIISATFRAYSAPDEPGAYWWITGTADVYADVYTVSDDSWLEDTVTWNTKPAMGSLLSFAVLDQGRSQWYEWDVTSGVKADSGDFFSLAMKAHDGTPLLCSFVSWEGAVDGLVGMEAYLVLEMLKVPPPEPDISVSLTSIDFGDVTVGSSSSAETVTVSNLGDADLVIGTINITGSDADQFSFSPDISGQTIAPSGLATFDVLFSPTSTGSKSTTLSIPSNDPDKSLVTASLSGTGVPVAPAPAGGVGGTAYPPNKLAILAPWIGFAIILAGGITWLVLRRRRAYQ